MESILTGILFSAIAAGAMIAFAALGELLSERAGVMNLGLEGLMFMGAVTGIIGTNGYGTNALGGVLLAAFVGLGMGLVFALATVIFKANQVPCGLALTFLGTGLARRLGMSYSGSPARDVFPPVKIPLLGDIPLIGHTLFDHTALVYIAYLVLPLLITYVLFRTRHGLHLRSVGENPAAADACGVSVKGMRFLYVCIGAMLAAIGGAYTTLAFTPAWTESVIAGRGWIALALVIFGAWEPLRVVLGAVLFGAATSIGFVAQVQGWTIPSAYLSMLPYLLTILLMILPYAVRRSQQQRRLKLAPAALGLPYYREEG